MSDVPLLTKLGVREGSRVLVLGDLDLGPLPAGAVLHRRAGRTPYDVAVVQCPDRAALERRWTGAHAAVTPEGRLWVAWPKRASGLQTDLDESAVREHGLAHDRVDVKVCAIDETWSGLAFVVRVASR